MNKHSEQTKHRIRACRLMGSWAALVLTVCAFTVPAMAASSSS